MYKRQGEFHDHLNIGGKYMNWKWYGLLENEYNIGEGANNQDFVALSDTIRILEGARNSVLPRCV